MLPPGMRSAPANLVICAGLLASANSTSLLASAGWQWANQSYNVGVNYVNRSSGSPPPERIAAAYAAATSSALAIALGMQAAGTSLERRLAGGADGASAARSRQLVRSGVRLTVPMLAVAIGSVVNLYFTRQSEIAEGVVLSTEEGLELGHSRAAAHQGLAKCATTRVLWTIALLTVTPIASGAALAALPASLAARQGVRFTLDLAVSFGVIWAAVPLCIALYPQRDCARLEALEPGFHGLCHPTTGARLECVWFNKGL